MTILRNILLASLLYTGVAIADQYESWVAENESGTKIMLSTIDCPVRQLQGSKTAVITHKDKTVYGCWMLNEETVIIAWFPPNEEPVITKYSAKLFRKWLLI
jgi:hypothetical protein